MSPATGLPDLPAGTMVGEYRIDEKIGEGGMGQVYRGLQPLIGKKIAIKVLAAEYSQTPIIVQRLIEEARAVNQIRHPNIIDIFSFGALPDGRPYFVMEFLEGESFEAALTAETLSPDESISLLEQLCRTLEAAHTAGFIHRDLKPENLWIVRTSNQPAFLKILDFGIAKNTHAPEPSLTATGEVLGTAYYMAPEQALGRAVDARTDIYAVGVILYRMLAGVLPFDDKSVYAVVAKHVTEQAKPPSSYRAMPEKLNALVMSCLAKDPAGRPQTARALWEDLKPALNEWAKAKVARPTPSPSASMSFGSTVVAEARRLSANSRATIQPIERVPTFEGKTRVGGGRGRQVGLFLATVTLLGGGSIAVTSYYGRHVQPNSAPVETPPVVIDAGQLPPAPAILHQAIPPSDRDEERAPASPPPIPSKPKKPSKASHDRGEPTLL
jgi:serine/threonine protein kinase